MMANKDADKNLKGRFDVGRALVYAVATFDAYAMGRVFHEYDPAGLAIGSLNVSGLILGAIINFIVARTAVHLPDLAATFSSLKALLPKASKKMDKKQMAQQKKDLKKMLQAGTRSLYSHVGYFFLLGFSVILVAPGLFMIWKEHLVVFSENFIKVMAFVGAIAPAVAITVAGFVSGEGKNSNQNAVGSKQKAVTSKPRKQGVQDVQVAGASGDKLQGASSKQDVQVAGTLQVQGDKQVRKQPVQDAALLAYWQSNPRASDGQVAQEFGMSRQAIQQRREKFIARGEIKMTENGVAILSIGVSLHSEVER